MRKRLLALLVLAPLLLAADTTPDGTQTRNACIRYTMCSAEGDVTEACDDGTNNLVAETKGHWSFGFDASASTATSFICTPYTGSAFSATKRSILNDALPNLTESQYGWGVEGTLAPKVWVSCSAIAGGTVTITMEACPK